MAIILSITPNLDTHPWDDLPQGEVLVELSRVGVLPNGTKEGRPALIFMGTVEGKPVCFQTSFRNMIIAMRVLEAAHGPFDLGDIQAFAALTGEEDA